MAKYGKTWRLILALLAASAMLAACASDTKIQTPDLDTLLAHGRDLLNQGDAAGAATILEQVVAGAPDSVDAHFLLGNAYSETNRYAEAENQYQQTLSLDPEHFDALCNLGVAYYSQGRLEEAESTLRSAVEQRSNDAESRYNLGGVILAQGRTGEALDQFLIANSLDPDLPQSYLGMGSAYYASGDMTQAATALQQYLDLTVDDGDTLWRARARELLDQIQETP